MDFEKMYQMFVQQGYPPEQAKVMAQRAQSFSQQYGMQSQVMPAGGEQLPDRGSIWNEAAAGLQMFRADPAAWLQMMTNPNAPAPASFSYPAAQFSRPAQAGAVHGAGVSPVGVPSQLQAQQEQRRYGGAPAGSFSASPRSPSVLNPVWAGAAGRWPFNVSQGEPVAGGWQQGMWDAMLAGQNPLGGVPAENWPEALQTMQQILPIMQQRYNQQQDAVGADQWQRQFGEAGRQFDVGQGNWQAQFGAGRQDAAFEQWLAQQQFGAGRQDAGFQQWLAQQQLGMQGGSQAFDQEMARRNFDLAAGNQTWNQGMGERQFGEGVRQFDVGQGNWLQQFQAGRDDSLWNRSFQENQAFNQNNQWGQQFQAGRDDALWNRGFNERQFGEGQRQFDVGAGQWNQQFGASRDDALWNRGFNEKQFGEGQRQFDTGMERNKALDAWSQAFSQAQFDWNQKQADVQNKQNEEGMYLSAFNRKFGPNVSSM